MADLTKNTAFIEIETDYEYVQGRMNEKAARFLLDFYHVQGQLGDTIKYIAQALHDTAIEFLELQGIGKESNLAKGIQAVPRGPAIELRSTAYRLPTTGKVLNGEKIGNDIVMRTRAGWHGELPKEKKNTTRVMSYLRGNAASTARHMIMPQGVDYAGATGGHYSLAAVPIYDSQGNKVGHDSHKVRYNSTKNVQYYGGHVEFGHKTRDGGGIGFVEARPHLRPALRVVADASSGWLAGTIANMIRGFGNLFDYDYNSIGGKIYGLNFGNVPLNMANIKNSVRQSEGVIKTQRAKQLRSAFSVRKDPKGLSTWQRLENKENIRRIHFGNRNIEYERYGYDDDTRAAVRKFQSFTNNPHLMDEDYEEPTIPRPGTYKTASEVRKKAHAKSKTTGRYPYKFRNNIGRKPKRSKTKKKESNHTKNWQTESRHLRNKSPLYRARHSWSKKRAMVNSKSVASTHKGNKKTRNKKTGNKKGRGKNNKGRKNNGKKGQREPNRFGEDPLKPTTWEDFMELLAKPDAQTARETGMSHAEFEDWVKDWKTMKKNAQEKSRAHNDMYKKLKWYNDRL